MSFVKISSIREIKHEVARLCRAIKRSNKVEAFSFEMQNNLIELAKIIRERVSKLKVELFLYDDEYTLNYFTDKVRWTSGVGEDGLVTYCYVDGNNGAKRGSFNLSDGVPEDFYIILENLSDKIQQK